LRLVQTNLRIAEAKHEAALLEKQAAKKARESAKAEGTCPSCGYQNPEGVKFCQECGIKNWGHCIARPVAHYWLRAHAFAESVLPNRGIENGKL